MSKAKGSLVPMRGAIEDWGPGKYQRNLERKDTYARRMWEQVAKGSPDFEKLLSEGAPRPKKEAAAGKKVGKGGAVREAAKKKPRRTAARKTKKKPVTRRRQ